MLCPQKKGEYTSERYCVHWTYGGKYLIIQDRSGENHVSHGRDSWGIPRSQKSCLPMLPTSSHTEELPLFRRQEAYQSSFLILTNPGPEEGLQMYHFS